MKPSLRGILLEPLLAESVLKRSGKRTKYRRESILIKLRAFRLAMACASIAALIQTLGAGQKWG